MVVTSVDGELSVGQMLHTTKQVHMVPPNGDEAPQNLFRKMKKIFYFPSATTQSLSENVHVWKVWF